MKKIFTSVFSLCLFAAATAQWIPSTGRSVEIVQRSDIKDYYSLDISLLRTQLSGAQEMGKNAKPVAVALPTLDGKIERFNVYSFPVMDKALADQYQLGDR